MLDCRFPLPDDVLPVQVSCVDGVVKYGAQIELVPGVAPPGERSRAVEPVGDVVHGHARQV